MAATGIKTTLLPSSVMATGAAAMRRHRRIQPCCTNMVRLATTAALMVLCSIQLCSVTMASAAVPAGPPASAAAAIDQPQEASLQAAQDQQISIDMPTQFSPNLLQANLMYATPSAVVPWYSTRVSCEQHGYYWDFNTCWTTPSRTNWCQPGYTWKDSCACCNKSGCCSCTASFECALLLRKSGPVSSLMPETVAGQRQRYS